MTTWSAPEDRELADALDLVVARLERARVKGATEAAREMRSAVKPGNGFRTASVPFSPQVRGPLVAVLREVAVGLAVGGRLNEIADGLEGELAVRAANGH